MRVLKKSFVLFVIISTLSLSSCSTTTQEYADAPVDVIALKPAEHPAGKREKTLTFLKEFLTIGLWNDKEGHIKELRKKSYEEKYVSDADDSRNSFEKFIGTATFELIFGRETKLEREERLEREKWEANHLVPKDEDDRVLLARLISRESLAHRSIRKKVEAQQQKELSEALLDRYPSYQENSVADHPKLAKLLYGKTTYDEALNVMGVPFKMTKNIAGEREALFKLDEPFTNHIPFVEDKIITVKLNFNKDGVLIKKP